MGRREYRQCAIRHADGPVNENGYIHGESWCGKKHSGFHTSNMEEGEDPLAYGRRMASCSDCSAAMGKVRLKQIADRVRVEKAETHKGNHGSVFRGAWHVYIDGQHMADVVMQNGWGNPWELRLLRMDEFDPASESAYRQFGECISGSRPGPFTRHSSEAVFQPVHFSSKDMMASAALKARDMDKLRLPEERRAIAEERRKQKAAEDAQREIDRAEWAKEREARDKRKEERQTLALDGIAAVLERTDLSNLERAGVEAARDIIEGKSA